LGKGTQVGRAECEEGLGLAGCLHELYFDPILAIELDDSSHREGRRRERDSFVDDALSAAELPLLRVPVRRSYSPQELADVIRQQVG